MKDKDIIPYVKPHELEQYCRRHTKIDKPVICNRDDCETCPRPAAVCHVHMAHMRYTGKGR